MKKLIVFIFSLSGFLLLSLPSFAADALTLCDPNGQFGSICKLTSGEFGSTLGSLLTLIFVVSIVAALFYLVWGGFKWLTSGGDKTAVGAAREHIVAAIIGLVVIFLAYFILNILVLFFTKSNINEIKIPTLGTPSSSSTKKCITDGNTCSRTGIKCCVKTSRCERNGPPDNFICQ